MCPEYGATVGFFPVDDMTLKYLKQTSRDPHQVAYVEAYLKAVKMFRDYTNADQDPVFSKVCLGWVRACMHFMLLLWLLVIGFYL